MPPTPQGEASVVTKYAAGASHSIPQVFWKSPWRRSKRDATRRSGRWTDPAETTEHLKTPS
eukprot:9687099-Alexandrium_andersonii.AAC.1